MDIDADKKKLIDEVQNCMFHGKSSLECDLSNL
jgi:hypothetical protein